MNLRDSLAVQWLRLQASMVGDEGSITGQETNILQPKIFFLIKKKYESQFLKLLVNC